MRINENMFGESGAVVNNDLYLHRVLPLDKPIVSGQNYTISGWIMPGETKTTIYLYNSDPRTVEVRISLTDITGYFSHTFTATEKERINKYINMYLSPSAEVSRSESYKIKLEEGQTLPWEDRWSMQKELYKTGDRVTHEGFVWLSKVDENHWEPTEANHAAWTKEEPHEN